jgi:hypothetical protein
MTEDMLKAKEAELLAMGESDDAAATRAHVQVRRGWCDTVFGLTMLV